MKKIIFLLTVILALSLCSCQSSQSSEPENNGVSSESVSPLPTEPSEEDNDITLPSQWGTIELPDINLDDPDTTPDATSPSVEPENPVTTPDVTSPSVEQEDPVTTTSPNDGSNGDIIELPEDTFD